jgi:8-oxo-dGTP diphosphatase
MAQSVPTKRQVSAGGVAVRRRGDETDIAIISVGEKARWQLPKGIVDAGESPELTAVREVREEAGIETQLVGPIDTIEYWYVGTERDGSRVRYHKRVHFFLLEYLDGDVADHDHEVNEARWMKIGEAEAALAFKSERDVVAKARALL